MAKVAVLLTSYNHARYLEKAIQSLLAQTFRDFEVVALDDASQDDSPQILQRYAPPFRLVLHASNCGTYKTLNEGIALTDAPCIAILNSDDVWLPTKLEQQVALLEANPRVGMVHTAFTIIDQDDQPVAGNPLGVEFLPNPQGYLLPELVMNNRIIASSVMFRRECVQKLGGFTEQLFGLGDWDLWLRIAEHYEIGYVPEPVTLYRVHGLNAFYDKRKMLHDDIWVRERIRQRVPELLSHDGQRLRRAIAHSLAALGMLYTLTGEAGKARQVLLESIRYNPLRFKTYLRLFVTFLPKRIRERIF